MTQLLAKHLYKQKVDYFESEGYQEIDALSFYRDIFPKGSFESQGDLKSKKPNGILFVKSNQERDKNQTILIFDDLSRLQEFLGQSDVIMSAIGYSGRRRTKKNAYTLFSFTVDLDGQEDFQKFKDTLFQMKNDQIPPATYTVLSGNGLHLYYVLKTPIGLTYDMKDACQRIKDGLTELVWNDFTSTIKVTLNEKNVKQFQSIVQGYRIVGSLSKLGEGYPVRAWITGPRWTLEELEEYFPKSNKAFDRYRLDGVRERTPLAIAKEKWPKWYARRILEKKEPGHWVNSENLYNWWLRQIKDRSRQGHRYYCIFSLATYAMKCNIPYERLKEDALSLLTLFDSRTTDESNHFHESDIIAGLNGYRQRAYTCTRDYIQRIAGIEIPKNKRNYRKQAKHLVIARTMKALKRQLDDDVLAQGSVGRPKGITKEKVIREWQQLHPYGLKVDCIRDTGLSKSTVYKYWKSSLTTDLKSRIQQWRKTNPNASKSDCIKELKVAKGTVYKYWK